MTIFGALKIGVLPVVEAMELLHFWANCRFRRVWGTLALPDALVQPLNARKTSCIPGTLNAFYAASSFPAAHSQCPE